MRVSRFLAGILCVAVGTAGTLAGCNSQHAQEAHHEENRHAHAEHSHEDEGPHGGHLIELGDEEYHAELVHDEATHKVAVYLLDSSARQSVSIPSQEGAVTLNLVVRQQPLQYRLSPVESSSDHPGQASEFSATDNALCDAICGEEDVKARLNVTIGGKPFVGMIEHHAHDHDHEHAHAHEHGHDRR